MPKDCHIAIVGMACRYPGARSPEELWQNVLAQRQAFRRIPPERLSVDDYVSVGADQPDRTYCSTVAVLEDYEFDRVRFRVSGNAFRASDIAHWLALEVAADALEDAGFTPQGPPDVAPGGRGTSNSAASGGHSLRGSLEAQGPPDVVPEGRGTRNSAASGDHSLRGSLEAQGPPDAAPGGRGTRNSAASGGHSLRGPREAGRGLPHETTGVFLGNTLTGEFSRAALMRLRWPYVQRVVEAALAGSPDFPQSRRETFLADLESRYKSPFPEPGDETLAGALSNTIAGRICNHFNLNGGGYTVDGACASSLLAAANACTALAAGDLDAAIAGGVDLSLDPLELVGFARVGALAREEMRVYDSRSQGFWPGEGCGMLVFMRLEDALKQGRRVYATVRGWGISSDGSGGITRPEADGQVLALRRAYRRAGFDIGTVAYFEGHGTGTAVGDATELAALSRALRETSGTAAPAAIGSVKALVGHTKAAAGAASLIKAALALHHQILPPTAGCERPHPEISGKSSALRALRKGEVWPPDRELRAAASGMGFGGINAHLVLEGHGPRRHRVGHSALRRSEQSLLASEQDAELLLFAADSREALAGQIERVLRFCARLSRSELTDLSAELARRLSPGRFRAAVVATAPEECARRLEEALGNARSPYPSVPPRIGLLFPGQGAPAHLDGGRWRRRFAFVDELYLAASWSADADGTSTAVAQPAIATAEVAALLALERFEIVADLAIGHSLGELTALHWGGAFDRETLLRIAACRGEAMGNLNGRRGAMAAIAAPEMRVRELLNGSGTVIAAVNSPSQTVISGEAESVAVVVDRARAGGLTSVPLAVSHAFHSPLVEPAARTMRHKLASESLFAPRRTVLSTVTGCALTPGDDVRALLASQISAPVRFNEAVSAAGRVDLWIEAGPGSALAAPMAEFADAPVVSLDSCGPSLKGLLHAVGAAFTAGAHIRAEALFEGRFARPFDLDWSPKFLANPCELAPSRSLSSVPLHRVPAPPARAEAAGLEQDAAAIVRALIAERAELPAATLTGTSRVLSDLHLNSIVVSGIVAEACHRLGLPVPAALTEYADASIDEMIAALENLVATGGVGPDPERFPAGAGTWLRIFETVYLERPLPVRRRLAPGPWKVFAAEDSPLRETIGRALAAAGGGGVAVCLGADPGERSIGLLLDSARAVLSREWPGRFVMVQHGGGAAAFARTLHLEARDLTTCVVDVPAGHPLAQDWVCSEIEAAQPGYTEARYDEAGVRREPVLKMTSPASAVRPALTARDFLLVTGGGKGIAAECALSLARETGVRLVLMGRSLPENDPELAANLSRMRNAGIHVRYVAADVTDAAAVRDAIVSIESESGPVTALLHGAGANVPQLLSKLDEAAFRKTLAPKVQGCRNVLAAIDPGRLRLLIAFGSIIARTGLAGEADYAVANEWLERLADQWRAAHPHCRAIVLEWSLWSGSGMGQRLGRVEALMQQGIAPIPTDDGIRLLGRLLASDFQATSCVVAGRIGAPPTVKLEEAPLPFRRFIETRRVHYRGIELIVDAEVASASDPYIDDHIFRGQAIFPAVVGLEAMAQIAMALAESAAPPAFENVEFARAVIVPATLRIAALTTDAGAVEVVLRSGETGFQVDHFRARCRFGETAAPCAPYPMPDARLPIDPADDLYGGLLFQTGRFRRLRGYRQLGAFRCIAEIGAGAPDGWFSRYFPQTLELGDPGARDAVLHSIQSCIPHRPLLPVGAERIVFYSQPAGTCFSHARERSSDGVNFVYDVDVWNADGSPRERWEGLRLRAMDAAAEPAALPAPLVVPYLERLSGASVRFRQDPMGTGLAHRPDGKPESPNGFGISRSHAGGFLLEVTAQGAIGCDIEPVARRSESEWLDLLGPRNYALATLVAREVDESPGRAATRLWAVAESLKKVGASMDAPLVFRSANKDGCVVFAAGQFEVTSCVVRVAGFPDELAMAVAQGR